MKESYLNLFLRLVFPSMVGLSLYGLSIDGTLKWVTTAITFGLKNHLHCYSQVGRVVTPISDYSVEHLEIKFFDWTATKKLVSKFLVRKLQGLIFLVGKRVVLLGHCMATSVPISPRSWDRIWFITLLKNTAPKNFMLPSSVNFITKSIKASTLYTNIYKPNKAFAIRQQMLILILSSTMLAIRILKMACVHVKIFS